MDNQILLLRLEGPMQSWGVRSRWDVRDTCLEPTKSGVLGLIGCALGINRGQSELERLDNLLRFGVRVDRPGVVSTDYHTVTGYHRIASGGFKHEGGTASSLETAQSHRPSTIVSTRDYLHDAAFLVALSVDPERKSEHSELLGKISNGLMNPVWPLYLGRKSCVPTRPVHERLTDEYESIERALCFEPWNGKLADAHPHRKLEAWIECKDGDFERQDAVRINQLRFYEFRRCRRIEIDPGELRRKGS